MLQIINFYDYTPKYKNSTSEAEVFIASLVIENLRLPLFYPQEALFALADLHLLCYLKGEKKFFDGYLRHYQ